MENQNYPLNQYLATAPIGTRFLYLIHPTLAEDPLGEGQIPSRTQRTVQIAGRGNQSGSYYFLDKFPWEIIEWLEWAPPDPPEAVVDGN